MLKFHGVTSLLLIVAAFVLGFYQIMLTSTLFGLIYLGIFALTYAAIFLLYCSKCPADLKTCPHVFQGALKVIFPVKKEGNYITSDYGSVALGFLAIALFPQYWLKENLFLLISFWLILSLGLLQIKTQVCTGCCNKKCIFCKNAAI